MEDQFNELKAKDDQQTQLIHDLNMQKARLQTQNGEDGQGPGVLCAVEEGGQTLTWAHLLPGAEPPSGEGRSDLAANQAKQVLTQQLEDP